MTTTNETVTVQGDNLTVSLIVWRRFSKPVPGLVEAIYDATPGLAALGAVLPVGTVLTIPVPAQATTAAQLAPVTLW